MLYLRLHRRALRFTVSEEILKNTKIIDLSADFRIKDVAKYEKWYGIKHQSPEFIKEAVYGLCEVNREDVKNARLIANPDAFLPVQHYQYTYGKRGTY